MWLSKSVGDFGRRLVCRTGVSRFHRCLTLTLPLLRRSLPLPMGEGQKGDWSVVFVIPAQAGVTKEGAGYRPAHQSA